MEKLELGSDLREFLVENPRILVLSLGFPENRGLWRPNGRGARWMRALLAGNGDRTGGDGLRAGPAGTIPAGKGCPAVPQPPMAAPMEFPISGGIDPPPGSGSSSRAGVTGALPGGHFRVGHGGASGEGGACTGSACGRGAGLREASGAPRDPRDPREPPAAMAGQAQVGAGRWRGEPPASITTHHPSPQPHPENPNHRPKSSPSHPRSQPMTPLIAPHSHEIPP